MNYIDFLNENLFPCPAIVNNHYRSKILYNHYDWINDLEIIKDAFCGKGPKLEIRYNISFSNAEIIRHDSFSSLDIDWNDFRSVLYLDRESLFFHNWETAISMLFTKRYIDSQILANRLGAFLEVISDIESRSDVVIPYYTRVINSYKMAGDNISDIENARQEKTTLSGTIKTYEDGTVAITRSGSHNNYDQTTIETRTIDGRLTKFRF